MTIQAVFDAILGQAGVIVLLLVILWSGWKRYWVFGSYYTEMQTELRAQIVEEKQRVIRVEARLDRAMGAAESGTGLADQALRRVEGRQGERSD